MRTTGTTSATDTCRSAARSTGRASAAAARSLRGAGAATVVPRADLDRNATRGATASTTATASARQIARARAADSAAATTRMAAGAAALSESGPERSAAAGREHHEPQHDAGRQRRSGHQPPRPGAGDRGRGIQQHAHEGLGARFPSGPEALPAADHQPARTDPPSKGRNPDGAILRAPPAKSSRRCIYVSTGRVTTPHPPRSRISNYILYFSMLHGICSLPGTLRRAAGLPRFSHGALRFRTNCDTPATVQAAGIHWTDRLIVSFDMRRAVTTPSEL